jgi:protein tyrosine phosphatase (PTP) superfamily phosphohydrolase (DUF442 family)
MLTEITNFIQLTENVGTSGQPTAAQFEEIAAHGYAAVINLALPSSDHAIAQEGSLVTSLGMTYLHIPVRFEQPTVDALRMFAGFMQALEGRKVWVHCVVNARVSAFMYLYLKHVKGFEDHAARSPLLVRWAPQMDDVWRAFLALDRADVVA